MASIKKRGKTWYVRFSKREIQWDPEKQKNVSVLRQKSKGGFKTKAEAQEYGIKMEAASLSGVDVIINFLQLGNQLKNGILQIIITLKTILVILKSKILLDQITKSS